tara:strand:+ start:2779 stop:3516 length:738 start_codon:yes stop_codon:yes gene_type:complete
MNYQLKIDNREKDIINILEKTNDLKFIKENLDIGDFQFIDNKNNLKLVIERKTLNDLSKSIKDGHYKEQKNRLLHSIDSNTRKIYLLEGDDFSKFELPIKVYDGLIINTILRDNIHIFKTKNIEDTIKFLNDIYTKISKLEFENNKENNNIFLSTVKKKNLNSKTCFINMLNGIPGVSNKIAESFLENFKNIFEFFNYVNIELNNNEDLIIDFLSNQKYGSNKRKVGKKTAEKIYLFLFNVCEEN